MDTSTLLPRGQSLASLAGRTRTPRPRRRQTLRLLGSLARCALFEPSRPLLAQIVVTRRCNLACGYCFEYDHHSPPVATRLLMQRIAHLARLRTVFVTLNGGEPLLHPECASLVAEIARRRMIPMINSNGFLLTEVLIQALNEAGLYGLQMSLDALTPSKQTRKALSLLRPKLELLSRHARFRVRINCVLGAAAPEEALELAQQVRGYGFDLQVSLRRDARGQLLPLSAGEQAAYQAIRRLAGRLPLPLGDGFQLALARGEASDWKCRSGARYFHVCEDGLVHLCQPRTGTPGTPLEDYDEQHLRHYFEMRKDCSVHCPHAYAHLGSRLDGLRSQPLADEAPTL